MKKRYFTMLMALVMVISMLPLAVYADTCAHEKTSHDIKSSTCTEEGTDKLVCDDCGAVISTTPLEKEAHIFVTNVNDGKCLVCNATKEEACEHEYEVLREESATCVLTGYVWKKCKLCGQEKNLETPIDADAHEQFVNGKCVCGYECLHETKHTDSVLATCAAEGYTKEICNTCDMVLSETTLEKTNEHEFRDDVYEGKNCIWCQATVQEVCEHEYEVVKAEPATCSLTGYAWEVCKLCGAEYNHETPVIASAHNFVNGKCSACSKPCPCDMERLDIKMASCNEEGYNRTLCVKCGKVLSEKILEKTNEHLFLAEYENGQKCRLCDISLQAACDHDYEIVREQAGTCIEAGYVWMECKLCHKEVNHETELDPEGHDYMVTDRTEATCEAPAHVWKRCVLCANKIDLDEGEAAGHEFANGKCVVCGEPDPDCAHANHVEDKEQYRAATCTVEGVRVYNCPDCGTEQRESIPMLGHIRVESTVEPTCTTAGTLYVNCTRCRMLLDTKVLPAAHNYVNGKCACGAVIPGTECTHPEESCYVHYQAATCTENGYRTKVCNDCNKAISSQTLPATGHNYVSGVCSECGKIDLTGSSSGSHGFTFDFQDVFLTEE